MSKFLQKHAQYAFGSKLKQQSAIKFEKKQSAKQKSAENKQIWIKTSNLQVFKKNATPQKKQAQIRGKSARLATLRRPKVCWQDTSHVFMINSGLLTLIKS